MPTVLLRLPRLEPILGIKRPTIYRHIKAGLFIRPTYLGPRVAVWSSDEVELIVAAVAKGATETQLKALVNELHAARGYVPDPKRIAAHELLMEKTKAKRIAKAKAKAASAPASGA